jgi:AAA+ superfamily predicted ATPase
VCLVGEVIALDLVDRAVLSRIPTRIELPVPDDQCRAEILRRLADRAGVSLGPDPDTTIANWSSGLRGGTGRELEHFVRGIAQRQILSTDERRLVAAPTDVSRTAADAPPPSTQRSESAVAGTSGGKDSDRCDAARESLSSLGIGDALLEQLQPKARLVRARDSDERIRTVLPRAFLFRGTTDAAMRCARAFAVEANLPCCVLDGADALAAERSNPGLLQARLDQIRTTGPCAVIITDAERLVAARGTSQYERAMGTAWVALRRHFEAQRDCGPYVPLIFTTTDLETMDQAILLGVTLRFELPPPRGVGHS